jgi:glycosyltransferase involved in cell wall biosynthesis
MKAPSVAFISTYVPRLCGIATFTHDNATAVSGALGAPLGQTSKVQIVALHRPADTFRYGPEVGFVLRQPQRMDYQEAAEFLNISSVDVVCLQHEYGIFGGDDGKYILDLLEVLRKPVVTTLHTVLNNPSEGQKRTLQRICAISNQVVVIADKAKGMLTDIYGLPEDKIVRIPHGVPNVPFMDPGYYKDRYHLEGKKVLLTFGLIGPGKGIEHAIDAVALLVKDFPNLTYVILGATHPEVKRLFGEAYRTGLEQRAEQKGIKDNVLFFDRYVSDEQLHEFLLMADLYITPYLAKEQISSGTLAFAMGCGKAIVSTPYWFAEEMLADGRGLLSDFCDAQGMADQLRRLLSDEVECNQIRKRAYQFTRSMTWEEVGHRYLETFSRAAEAGVPSTVTRRPVATGLPEINLAHLRVLTDGTGLLQHAIFATPERDKGYTTDDNARALRFVIRYWNLFKDDSVLPLAQTYLAFLLYAFNEKANRFHNFMAYDRHWLDEEGSDDCQGRTLGALADSLLYAPNDSIAGIVKRLFEQALPASTSLVSPRAWAWTILGCDTFLKRFGGAREVREVREDLSARLIRAFEGNSGGDWIWCENEVTYDNGRICKALMVAEAISDPPMRTQFGLRSLEWLMEIQTDPRGHLSIIGNQGWLQRGGTKAPFDQQPIDAAALLSACHDAYRITGEAKWKAEMKKCFNWFLGANDLNMPLYDFMTHGCHDGLHDHGISRHQGAESTLSWLMSALRMHQEGGF